MENIILPENPSVTPTPVQSIDMPNKNHNDYKFKLLIIITILLIIIVSITYLLSGQQKQGKKNQYSYTPTNLPTQPNKLILTFDFESVNQRANLAKTPKPARNIQSRMKIDVWPVYRDTFDGMTITYRYPPGYTIFDEDTSTPLLISYPNNADESEKEIRIFRILPDVPYNGEPIADWFTENVLFNDLDSNMRTLSLQPVTVNSKEFLLVQKQEETVVDYYYGIQKAMPFYISNNGVPEDQFIAMLDSFTLVNPPKILYYQKFVPSKSN